MGLICPIQKQFNRKFWSELFLFWQTKMQKLFEGIFDHENTN